MPRLRYHAWLIAKAATRFILPVFPLPRLTSSSTGGGGRGKKVVKRIIEITPGASPAFTTIYLHRRYIKESLGIFTRGTEGSPPPCLRYSRFPLSVLVLHARMQSAWTISRTSLEKGVRARRKRDGGERRDGKERKEKEMRGERGGGGEGVKRRPTSNVRHYLFLLYSFQVREDGER